MRLLFFYGMRTSSAVSFWRTNPLAGTCLFYIAGLFAYHQAGKTALVALFAIVIAMLVLAVVNSKFAPEASVTTARKLKSFLLLSLFAAVGAICAHFSKANSINRLGIFDLQGNHLFRLELEKQAEADTSGILRFSAAITHYSHLEAWSRTHAKVKCRLLCKPAQEFNQGTILYMFGSLDFPFTGNKSDFNFPQWLISNGYSATLNGGRSWLSIPSNKGIQSSARNIRQWLIGNLNDDEYPDVDRSLAHALLLGDRDKLEPELIEQFSTSGIIHLLAVSGLHVGLIYQGLILIFALFLPKPEKRKGAGLLIILILWAYAIITGFSPSVCRAALMLSIGVLGGIIRQRKLPFNTLFGAAILILAFDSKLITNTGFLLSFSAVAGILLSAPLLKNVQFIQLSFARQVLGASVISISAQLVTLPVVLHTFGKFPVYFLPANLLAVPLATIVSFCGFLSLLFSRIAYLGDVLTWVCMMCIHWLSVWSCWISLLPYASLSLDKPDLCQSLILSALILSVFLLGNGVKYYQLLNLLLILVLICSFLQFNNHSKHELRVADLNRVEFINQFHKVSIGFLSKNYEKQKLMVCNSAIHRTLLFSKGNSFILLSARYFDSQKDFCSLSITSLTMKTRNHACGDPSNVLLRSCIQIPKKSRCSNLTCKLKIPRGISHFRFNQNDHAITARFCP